MLNALSAGTSRVCKWKVVLSIKEIEARTAELSIVMKHAATYRQLKPVYDRYRQSRDKEKFLRGHESEIILFEAAARELKRMGTVPLPSTKSMKTELADLVGKKDALLAEYRAARSLAHEYETIKKMWMPCCLYLMQKSQKFILKYDFFQSCCCNCRQDCI